MKDIKIVDLPNSRFKIVAVIKRKKGQFIASIDATILKKPLTLKVNAANWEKAIKGVRETICIMDALWEYGVTGKVNLPPDLQYLSHQVPHFHNYLVTNDTFCGYN
jgi:hypothetical protein